VKDLNTLVLPSSLPESIQQAVSRLQAGELVAFPTDTVYGLGANVFDPQAIRDLFQVKERDALKAIAVLVGSFSDLELVTLGLTATARKLAKVFWPGALTLVVPRHPNIPEVISPLNTIGVRMPDHPDALKLLKAAGPLAVTSANLSGGLNTTSADKVLAQLADRIPLLLDGGTTPGGKPSTVIDCTGLVPTILREGPVSKLDIDLALQEEQS
jgi:L-threonylcarbamoyladenylate synthase